MNKYLIIGQGDIGLPVACQLSKLYPVVGVSYSPKIYQDCGDITHWQMDALSLKALDLQDFTHIAIIVSPNRQISDRAQAYADIYLAICQHLAGMANDLPHVRQVLFVSSTSVYGENAGQIIDEYTPVLPNAPTAKILYQAERAIVNAFTNRAVIVRPSGIYGKNRRRMIELAKSAHIDGTSKAQYTNRIMDTDLVAVLVRILLSDEPKALYLATDFCPVSYFEVLAFICQRLNLAPPKMIYDTPKGKRIISNLPKDWLKFTDYQQGYAWILNN